MGKLVVFLPDGRNVDVKLDRERVTIGRRPDNDVCLPYPAVSGEHAAVVTILADSFLEDVGSTNGTLVNGKPVAKHFLRDRDRIDIGKQKIIYVADDSVKLDPDPPDVARRRRQAAGRARRRGAGEGGAAGGRAGAARRQARRRSRARRTRRRAGRDAGVGERRLAARCAGPGRVGRRRSSRPRRPAADGARGARAGAGAGPATALPRRPVAARAQRTRRRPRTSRWPRTR